MKSIVEGPKWMGMWTEVCVDTLESLGHEVDTVCSNKKSLMARLYGNLLYFASGFNSERKKAFVAKYIRRDLNRKLAGADYDLFLSIQGKVTRGDILSLRSRNPGVKIIYWWGDILIGAARKKIQEINDVVDCLLVSYRGDYQSLKDEGIQNLYYFPFSSSEKFHSQIVGSENEKNKYASRVSFVGTYYPERGELIRYLNANLAEPVRVWGRSWDKCQGVKSSGRLTMDETLKVHRYSDISLNMHHHKTNDGFNMKFYEIPAAGGFQIVDWHSELENIKYGEIVESFKCKEELLQKIKHYLERPADIERLKVSGKETILKNSNYLDQFTRLLDYLEIE